MRWAAVALAAACVCVPPGHCAVARRAVDVHDVSFVPHHGEGAIHAATLSVAYAGANGSRAVLQANVSRVQDLYAQDVTLDASDGSLNWHGATHAAHVFHGRDPDGQWVVVALDPRHPGSVLSVAVQRRGDPFVLQVERRRLGAAYSGYAPAAPVIRDILADPTRDELSFIPNCYPDDVRRSVVDLGVATSKHIWQNYGQSLAVVQARIELILAQVNEIWAAQFNMVFRIKRMRLAGGSVPRKWYKSFKYSEGNCPKYHIIRDECWAYPSTLNTATQGAATWLFAHGCPNAGSGWAQTGSMCNERGSTAIVRHLDSAYLVLHELGHSAGGMYHFFNNGKRESGGLMDYGDGKIRGTDRYAYSIASRSRSCWRLTKTKRERRACKYWNPATGALACGDRYLLPEEECECADGTASCSGCRGCRIEDAQRECSTETFYMHADGEPPGGDVSSPECCTAAGKLRSAAATCDSGAGRCSFGKCVNPCAAYGLRTCGSDNDGCLLKCGGAAGGSDCRNDYMDPEAGARIGELRPDTRCTFSSNGSVGVCRFGSCVDSASLMATPRPSLGVRISRSPSTSPTPYPTTAEPTLFPTPSPSGAPVTPRPSRLP